MAWFSALDGQQNALGSFLKRILIVFKNPQQMPKLVGVGEIRCN